MERRYNIVLYDGHCTSDSIQDGTEVAIIGLSVRGQRFHAYANMACMIPYEECVTV